MRVRTIPSITRILRLAVVLVPSLALATAAAAESPVVLGKVTAKEPRLEQPFRRTIEDELLHVDLTGIRADSGFVLSAALVRIETHADGDRSQSRCVVSATITQKKSGALKAVIEGRGRVEDGRAASNAAELAAMQAAVRSALVRLPEALR